MTHKKWTSSTLRSSFLNFFTAKNHTLIPSSSIIPEDDKSLLFTNSGMVQFKKRFLNEKSNFDNLKRACSIQHCIRAGGKHNDLDDVGFDTYHHTFFEMMGFWSFSDYGKKESIEFAFEYLTDILKLDKNRLYVTYYGKSKKNTDLEIEKDQFTGIDDDEESKIIWQKFLPKERILPFQKENFWEMGSTGPCGPCTEIHYDMKGTISRTNLVNKDDPTLIEIWNIVFMQYFRNEDQSLKKLDNLSVDTGMGFERLLGILNNCSNYETDLFVPLFSMTELKYKPDRVYFCDRDNESDFKNESDLKGSDLNIENSLNKLNLKNESSLKDGESNLKDTDLNDNVALRIIADHARTIAICLFNNLKYSPIGQGYVLRRITRRFIRVAEEKKISNLSEIIKKAAFLLEIDLKENQIILFENENILFRKTLKKGLKYFNNLKNIDEKEIFKLKDTFGFPFDLTMQMCREKGIKIDEEKLNEFVKEAIEKSKQRKK